MAITKLKNLVSAHLDRITNEENKERVKGELKKLLDMVKNTNCALSDPTKHKIKQKISGRHN